MTFWSSGDVLRQRLESPELRRRILAHAEAHGAMAVLIEEAFPHGRYDDQVNSPSQLLSWDVDAVSFPSFRIRTPSTE